MRIARLKLANVRAIKATEFRFRPGFNLIVGVNGVGKTTVLDSLAVCLSAAVREANKLRGGAVSFDMADIRMDADALDVECEIEDSGENARYGYAVHKSRDNAVPLKEKSEMPREQVVDTPDRAEFVGKPPVAKFESGGRPMAILFSTNRAAPSRRGPPKSATLGGVSAAFANALSKHRGLVTEPETLANAAIDSASGRGESVPKTCDNPHRSYYMLWAVLQTMLLAEKAPEQGNRTVAAPPCSFGQALPPERDGANPGRTA